MRDRVRERYEATKARIHRIERRELAAFRRWIENTRNLVHLSVVVFVPLLIALVTWLSNAVGVLPFLLFPPLASGAYMLFARPESEYASPRRFVGGLTAGAFCGWIAFVLADGYWIPGPTGQGAVHPLAAAFSVFLTGVVTWLLDLEEASAYASALLVHVIDVENGAATPLLVTADFTLTVSPRFAYVLSVLVSSSLVAGVFLLWRREFYEQRARYLYQSTKGDDHVLVPMRTDSADATAMLGARLAAAHEAGKVVLLDLVDDRQLAAAERELLDRAPDGIVTDGAAGTETGTDAETEPAEGAVDATAGKDTAAEGFDPEEITDVAEHRAAADAATRLEERARRIETRIGVPCQVVVAVEGTTAAATVLQTARETNCDLVATPYEQRHGGLSPFVRSLFDGNVDVLVHRSADGRTRWRRAMVPVRRASDVAHAMIDFALRLTGRAGLVSICHCLPEGGNRRRAEDMLANLVEPFEGRLETRVARADIESYLTAHDAEYDLVFLGASTDRTTASRLISPPTFERIQGLECDVAVLDRNVR